MYKHFVKGFGAVGYVLLSVHINHCVVTNVIDQVLNVHE